MAVVTRYKTVISAVSRMATRNGREKKMNHRQWKKNFKKIHGRNPYFWEDRRVKSKSMRYNLEEMCEAIDNLPKRLAEILADAAEALSDWFANLTEVLRRVRDSIEVESETKE